MWIVRSLVPGYSSPLPDGAGVDDAGDGQGRTRLSPSRHHTKGLGAGAAVHARGEIGPKERGNQSTWTRDQSVSGRRAASRVRELHEGIHHMELVENGCYLRDQVGRGH